MLGLISLDDISYVLNGRYGPNHLLSDEPKRFIEVYKKRPGFFQPYLNAKEFAGGLIAPIVYPLGFAALGIIGIVASIALPLATLGSWFVGIGAGILGYTPLHDQALNAASQFLYFTGYALVNAVAGLLLAALSIPCSLVTLGTRSLATVGAEVLECMNEASTTTEIYTSMLI
ncbi:Uncharacterised protein [Legionella steigerwaltii]|uniref:Uncharacterized protein n=1 Tax=Legionella steigerwaltii TaxID=460 RepID=A0A378L7D5_9GAMM|nr:hypothetical protein [Legionella steigerwaltii]KTD79159.1 hypothetical protein Lstg_0918 [Legionella steigerwaltii]STY22733.1 Uncharacterised protein [Legionella steigerwaltii]